MNSADTVIVTPSVQKPSVPFRNAVLILRGRPAVLLLPPPETPAAPDTLVLTLAVAVVVVEAWTVTPVMLTLPPLQQTKSDTHQTGGTFNHHAAAGCTQGCGEQSHMHTPRLVSTPYMRLT